VQPLRALSAHRQANEHILTELDWRLINETSGHKGTANNPAKRTPS
jgi:hypothetical protein